LARAVHAESITFRVSKEHGVECQFHREFLNDTLGRALFTAHREEIAAIRITPGLIDQIGRKKAVERWCASHGLSKARFYGNAKVHKKEYYKWENNKLPDKSKISRRLLEELSK